MDFRAQFERLAPAGLVPLAWAFAGAATVSLVDRRTLTIGLVVMGSIFAVFAAHPRMGEAGLSTWRGVLAAGVVLNAVGVAGLFLATDPGGFLAVTLYGWMVLPAVGLAGTAEALGDAGGRYRGFAIVSLLGAGVYLLAGSIPLSTDLTTIRLVGLGVVAAGQTAGVLDGAARNAVA
jgi:hypothetical protein